MVNKLAVGECRKVAHTQVNAHIFVTCGEGFRLADFTGENRVKVFSLTLDRQRFDRPCYVPVLYVTCLVCCASIHVSVTHVLSLVKSLLGPPYPYLKARGMWRPFPQQADEPSLLYNGHLVDVLLPHDLKHLLQGLLRGSDIILDIDSQPGFRAT